MSSTDVPAFVNRKTCACAAYDLDGDDVIFTLPADAPLRVPLADAVAVSVLGVLAAIGDAIDGRQVCAACGCLCNPYEVCPGCRARRLQQ